MRVLIFHGYLLKGTGSNVYNAELGAALVRAGHELHLLCQDRDPFALDWVDAAGDWDAGRLSVRRRRGPVPPVGPPARGARAGDGVPAGHRRAAAALRRRSLRGDRGAPLPRALG